MEDSDKTSSRRVNTGRWTTVEHLAFIEGLRLHGREWRKVSTVVPTRTVVQIRTHAQKYYQKLAKEHGAEAAERAFTSGVQLGVDMGTRVADAEVDSIFLRYPDAAAAAKRTEDVLPSLPRNSAPKFSGTAAGSSSAAAAPAPAPSTSSAASAAASARRAAKRRRPPPREPEAPVRVSARSGTRSRRAIAAAVAADTYADDYEDEDEAGAGARYMDEPPVTTSDRPPRGVRRRMELHARGGNGLALAQHGAVPRLAARSSVPPTPTTENAALMLLQGKTQRNFADGKRTPRTIQAMAWLETVSAPPVRYADRPGIARDGRTQAGATHAVAPPQLPSRNPWGAAGHRPAASRADAATARSYGGDAGRDASGRPEAEVARHAAPGAGGVGGATAGLVSGMPDQDRDARMRAPP